MLYRSILLLLVLLCTQFIYAQDTIRYANGEIMIGQVEEIQRSEIRFRTTSSGNSVVVTVAKSDLQSVSLHGGQRFQFGPADWSEKEKSFLERRNIISLDLLAPALDHVTIGYERAWKPQTSLVLKVGRIGIWNRVQNAPDLLNQGLLVKVGTRHMLQKRLARSAGLLSNHPLAGWYVRPEIMFSYWTKTSNDGYYYPMVLPYERREVKQFHSSTAVNLIFGGQFFISERFGMDLYTGLGYGVSWRNGVTQPENGRGERPENYMFSHTFFGGASPLCVSGGVLLGYAF